MRNRKFIRRLTKLLYLPLAMTLIAVAFAQTPTGTLEGTVVDQSGASVPGATVSIRNVATNEIKRITTEPSGRFVQPFLLPGVYTITVEAQGFRSARQENLKLDVGQTRAADFALEVASVNTTVKVEAAAPSLDTESSALGQVIENQRVADLPLNGRDVFQLVNIASNVIPMAMWAGNNSYGLTSYTAGVNTFSPGIGGADAGRSDITIDGISTEVPENTANGTVAYEPIVDSVQEFNVVSGTPSAEYGYTSGGVVNVATKSGTNTLHGSGFYFRRDSALDANTFFNNEDGLPKPDFKRTQYGGTVGGPVYIPKVYNGKDKTFFFFGLERTSTPSGGLFTAIVPLAQWKNGDFSSGSLNIYDPTQPTPDPNNPGSWLRPQFPGNIIPQSVLNANPVASNVIKFYPAANLAGAAAGQTNYAVNGSTPDDTNRFDLRMDHNFTSNWRMFARLSRAQTDLNGFNLFGNVATPPANQIFKSWNGAWDNTFTLNPTTILNVRYGYSRMDVRSGDYPTFDVTQLGYSQAFANYLEDQLFPNFVFGGNGAGTGVGMTAWGMFDQEPSTHNVSASLTKILSRHTLKVGGEYRKIFSDWYYPALPAGYFDVGNDWTAESTANTSASGNAFASFLVGGIDWGAVTHDPSTAMASSYGAGYVQDDFKASSRLTLNIGVRYDVETPRTDRFNQLSYFDLHAPSPIASQVAAIANTTQCPACANLTGAMYYVGQPGSLYGRTQVSSPIGWANFAPRVGFAYRPLNNTVIRGGYAILYDKSTFTAGGTSSNPGLDGATLQYNYVINNPNSTMNATISDPYPQGYIYPLGNKSGPLAELGSQLTSVMYNPSRMPYSEQWNLNIQQQLSHSTTFEVGYVGNRGMWLEPPLAVGANGISYNQLNPSYMSLGNQLNVQVPNPFYGIDPSSTALGSQVTQAQSQLLSPYPQYSEVATLHLPDAFSSYYNSLTFRLSRRFSQGLSAQVALTVGKETTDAQGSPSNIYNLRQDWALSPYDVSHRLVVSWVYQLPFGKGQKFLSTAPAAVNRLVDGWQVNGIVTWQDGVPLAIGGYDRETGIDNLTNRLDYTGQNPKLGNPTLNEWFNTAAFTQPPNFTFGDVSATLPDVRGPGLSNADISLFKNNYLGHEHRFNIQYRLEMFNTLNHPFFESPDTTITDGNFGRVTATVPNTERQIQMALKFIF